MGSIDGLSLGWPVGIDGMGDGLSVIDFVGTRVGGYTGLREGLLVGWRVG